MQKQLTLRNKLCYGIGTIGYSSLSQTMNSFIMFFSTSVMGLSGSLTGIAIAIASLWDGISDPLVGQLSDNTNNKLFGKRLGYCFFAILGICICNILLWSMPKSSQISMFLWLLFFLLLQETVNTFFATPMNALALDIAPGYKEQVQLQSFKSIFNIIGMLLPSFLIYFFMPSVSIGFQIEYTQLGFIYIAIVNSILMLLFGMIGVYGNLKIAKSVVYVNNYKNQKESIGKLLLGYFNIFKKKSFACVILGYSTAQIASSLLMSIGMHLFTYCYHFSSTQISILLLCLFGGAICSQFIWTKVSNINDKKFAIISGLSVILLGLGMTVITFIFRNYIDIVYIFITTCFTIVICGIGMGALYTIPISMYSDVVSLERYKSGENKTGTYLGYYSFTYNISNSISLLCIGVLLDFIKFDSNQPVQPLSVQKGLGLIVFCGCSLALTASILIFSKYKIKRAEILKVQKKLST